MGRWVVPINSRALAILVSNPTPLPMVAPISTDVECAAAGDAKEPIKAQIDVQVDYIMRVVRSKPITSQSAIHIKVIAVMGGLGPSNRRSSSENDAV